MVAPIRQRIARSRSQSRISRSFRRPTRIGSPLSGWRERIASTGMPTVRGLKQGHLRPVRHLPVAEQKPSITATVSWSASKRISGIDRVLCAGRCRREFFNHGVKPYGTYAARLCAVAVFQVVYRRHSQSTVVGYFPDGYSGRNEVCDPALPIVHGAILRHAVGCVNGTPLRLSVRILT